MKKSAFTIFCLLLTTRLFAQNCSQCIFLQSNKIITETAYLNGDASYSFVIHVPANNSTTKLVTLETFGVDGKSLGKKTFPYQCVNNVFAFDIHSEPNQANLTGMKSTTGPSIMTYPAGMKVGERFPDTDIPFTITMYGADIDWVDKISNRRVVGQETITSTAGTWNALKITYDLTEILKGGHPSNPPVYHVTEWYVPGFGIVQYEGYGRTVKITKIAG